MTMTQYRAEKIKRETVLGWAGTILVMSVTGVYAGITFAYGQFESKEHAREVRDQYKEDFREIKAAIKEVSDKLDAAPKRR